MSKVIQISVNHNVANMIYALTDEGMIYVNDGNGAWKEIAAPVSCESCEKSEVAHAADAEKPAENTTKESL